MENVHCVSVVGKVNNGHTLGNVMNISEVEHKIQVQDLNRLRGEREFEYQEISKGT